MAKATSLNIIKGITRGVPSGASWLGSTTKNNKIKSLGKIKITKVEENIN